MFQLENKLNRGLCKVRYLTFLKEGFQGLEFRLLICALKLFNFNRNAHLLWHLLSIHA